MSKSTTIFGTHVEYKIRCTNNDIAYYILSNQWRNIALYMQLYLKIRHKYEASSFFAVTDVLADVFHAIGGSNP